MGAGEGLLGARGSLGSGHVFVRVARTQSEPENPLHGGPGRDQGFNRTGAKRHAGLSVDKEGETA